MICNPHIWEVPTIGKRHLRCSNCGRLVHRRSFRPEARVAILGEALRKHNATNFWCFVLMFSPHLESFKGDLPAHIRDKGTLSRADFTEMMLRRSEGATADEVFEAMGFIFGSANINTVKGYMHTVPNARGLQWTCREQEGRGGVYHVPS